MKYAIGSNQHKVRIIHNNKVIKKFVCDGRKMTGFQALYAWFIKWVKRITITSFITGILFATFHIGATTAKPVTVFADRVTPVPTMPDVPVLDRIAKCENNGSQYGKNGQVGYHINTNNTIDIGKYEINSVWFSTATKMGYDLTKPADNEAFAQYLYLNYGTSPWNDSSSCWNK